MQLGKNDTTCIFLTPNVYWSSPLKWVTLVCIYNRVSVCSLLEYSLIDVPLICRSLTTLVINYSGSTATASSGQYRSSAELFSLLTLPFSSIITYSFSAQSSLGVSSSFHTSHFFRYQVVPSLVT